MHAVVIEELRGGDHIDWNGIAAALHEIGYDGDVVIESFTKQVAVVARAAAIWRKIEPSRDDIAVNGLAFLRKTLGMETTVSAAKSAVQGASPTAARI